MYDNTQKKIIDATMNLVMERGYASTTTKDIAKLAGINECTIFRKFSGKKDIVMAAINDDKWNPCLNDEDFFDCSYNLKTDLINFSNIYMQKVTPEMVKISMGLRTPELYDDTKNEILKVPQTFKRVLDKYFLQMKKLNKIKAKDIESLSMMFLSVNFGFVFLKGSFKDSLCTLEQKIYIENSVDIFVNGIVK